MTTQTFELLAQLKADVSDFKSKMGEAARTMENFYDDTGQAMQNIGGAMTGVGKILTAAVTLPIVGFGAAAIKVGAEFEQSMSTVQALSGATGEELKALEDKAREMGATTRYSASQSADALGYMALAGWNTEQMIAGLPPVLDLATAGQLELAQASDIVTDMMSMFGYEAEEAARVSDIFAQAQANSNTNVEQLNEALKNAGPAAAAANQSLETTSSILGILANNGIKGGEAGTLLNNMFNDLQSSAEGGAIAIGDTSIAIYDAQGNMRDMADIITDIEKATEGMTQEQKDAELQNYFNIRSMKGLNTILNAGSDELNNLKSTIIDSNGAASEMAEEMDNNLIGSFLGLKSALEEAMLSFYEMGEGPLKSLVDKVTEIVRAFGNLSDGAKQTIIIIAGIIAAIGPLLLIFGGVINVIGIVTSAFGLVSGAITTAGSAATGLATVIKTLSAVFGVLFSPIGVAIVAITAFIGVMIYLYNTNETVREAILTAWNWIKETVMTVVEAVVGFVMELWGGMVDWWVENQALIRTTAESVWTAIYTIITHVMQIIVPKLILGWITIKTVIQTVWGTIKTIISSALKIILNTITLVMAIIEGDWDSAWQAIKNILSAVWETFISIISIPLRLIQNFILNALSAIQTFWGVTWEDIRQKVSQIWTQIVTVVKDKIGDVKSAIKEGLNNALQTIKDTASSFLEAGKNIVSNIAQGIRNGVSAVTDAIGGVLSKARDMLPFSPPKDKSSPLVDIHKNGIVEQIAKGIYNQENEMNRALSDVLEKAMNRVNDFSATLNLSIDGDIQRTNRQINGSINHTLQTSKQPLDLRFSLGKQDFSVFVDDISSVQKRKESIRLRRI